MESIKKTRTKTTYTSLFISHGAPDILLNPSDTLTFFEDLGESLVPPDLIIAISAHWVTLLPTFSSAPRPDTIHDFQGFPDSLYSIRYPAPGAPGIAHKLSEDLKRAGIPCQMDPNRGFDHGTWVPLSKIFPDALIPVLPMSLPHGFSPDSLLQLGTLLREAAPPNTLLFASGGATHNLSAYRPGQSPLPKSVAFDTWLKTLLTEKKAQEVLEYVQRSPFPRFNHPTDEHLFPLFVAMGYGYDASIIQLLHEGFSGGSISLASYGFAAQDTGIPEDSQTLHENPDSVVSKTN
ncbi:MAG: DODA-type extradiol aromatic ring-opening family dioxygenase [Leptospirales bacterium]